MCGILCSISNNVINIDTFVNKLNKLQHRGQNSFGIFYLNNIISFKGLIRNYNFDKNINSKIFMGHTRYITSGSKDNNVILPMKGTSKFGEFIFIFNGNIDLDKYNKKFCRNFTVDTLLIKDFLENCSECDTFNDVLIKFINIFDRAFSIIIYINDIIYCMRDRYGVRPLSYIINNDEILISSEINVKNTNIECGEIIKIENYEISRVYILENTTKAQCLFEYIYFMNEESIWNNIKTKNIREEYGKQLAKYENQNILNNKNKYIVIGIPNSGIQSAKGYAKYLNLKYEQLITKNKNINRTFILNTDNERITQAQSKYIFNEKLNNKNIILFDDSIVRGITIKLLIKNLKLYGVNEIHIRIASPQIKYECKYGIDIPTQTELIMNKYDEESIVKYLECDSLTFINLDKIKKVMDNYNSLCTGCFNKNYNDINW